MKVLLLNGSPHKNGCTHTALAEVASVLTARGIEIEEVWIGTKAIAGCIACGSCRAGGRCAFEDVVNEVADRIGEYQGIIVGSPVYYAGISGQVTAFLDRLFYMKGRAMEHMVGAGVVSCRRGGASAAFDIINKYFLMNNMYVVGSQYWNQVHGNTPEEVMQDAEGLQTMRTLGENMAYLLRAMSAAEAEGVPEPKMGDKIRTNFIR